MKRLFKIAACAMTALATAPMARPAEAANRAFSSTFALLETPSSVGCFSHAGGYAALRNTCSTPYNVFLPMSFDGASWYTLSVYGQGWIDSTGKQNSIYCTANLETHDNSSVLLGNTWQGLPAYGFGAPQKMVLGSIPISAPGDAGYGYCIMTPYTRLFTYGWN